ncbi:MAG TPA: CDP-alcohol phosphatidyltransferase family protein [Nitrospiria bacterium]|nr:CDP-alcohol phosphatidyltransferase family protein [Nitrospiria bacterium]
MNLPNLITILRIIFIPFFIDFMIYGYYDWALAVFLVAGLTDSLDGLVARLSNQRTRLGAYLDPAADKLLLTAGFVTLAVLKFIPFWVAVVVVSRDVILVLGSLILHLIQGNQEISPTIWGKGTTAIQIVYVGLVLFFSVLSIDTFLMLPLLVLMVGITVFSGFHYIYRGIRNMNSRHLKTVPEEKGP